MAVATNSGSEAIDVSIRMARKWGYQVKRIPPGEALILTASANYHGRTMMPLSSSENPKYREGEIDVRKIDNGNTYSNL
jgi:ornithine--oxo-acid transaminase